MTSSPKYLYLPVETAARELDAKLLLALYAANAGFDVTLASRALLNSQIHQHPPGIYLSHNFDKGRARILKILANLGHQLMAWDEEGLVWLNEDAYRTRRVNSDSVRRLHTIFAWGNQQAAILKSLSPAIVPIGNPRADLLSRQFRPLFADKAARLNDKYGDFILINSNFGWLNYALDHGCADEDIDTRLKRLADKSRHSLGYLQYRHRIFTAFCDLIPILSNRFKTRQIIIRPHPSESPKAWQAAIAGLDNVSVRYDSDLAPWLLAAGIIIHNGCTTAVETAMLERPVIAFEPETSPQFDSPQPHAVSTIATNADEVINAINSPAHTGINLGEMISGWGQKPSAPEIVNYMFEHYELNKTRPSRIAGQLQSRFRQLEKTVSRKHKKSSANPSYINQKFPPTNLEQIKSRAEAICQLANLKLPVITSSSDRIFSLEPV